MTEQEIKTALEQINSRLAALEGAARLPKKPELTADSVELWTVKDIAKYTGYSYRYVSVEMVAAPDFPPSVGNQGKNARKRYISGDVIRYFERRRNSARKKALKRDLRG